MSCFAGGFALAGDLAATVEASGHLTRPGQKGQKVSKEFIQKKNVSQQFARITRNGSAQSSTHSYFQKSPNIFSHSALWLVLQ